MKFFEKFEISQKIHLKISNFMCHSNLITQIQFSKPSLKLASITTRLLLGHLLGHLCTKIFENLVCGGHLLDHEKMKLAILPQT